MTVSDLPARGLRRLAMPVVAIAAEHDDRRSCSTATASYATLDPPTLIVSLAARSATTALVLGSRTFSASALATDQVQVALAAAGRATGADKLAELGIPVTEGDDEFTVVSVAGAPVAWCCRVTGEVPVGDHVVVFGEIVAVRGAAAHDEPPLLRHDRQYAGLGMRLAVQDGGGYPL